MYVMTTDATMTRHRRQLLLRRRCSYCAERISRLLVVRGGQCPSCGRDVHADFEIDVETVIRDVTRSWRGWRWLIYPTAWLASLLGGWIPFVHSILMFVALTCIHLLVVRRPLRWLSFGRRMTSRFTVKLFIAALAIGNFLLDILLLPLIGLNGIILSFVALGTVMLYTEGVLWFISNRLRYDTHTSRLQLWEWVLPVSLIGLVVGLAAIWASVVGTIAYGIYSLEIPSVTEVVDAILSWWSS